MPDRTVELTLDDGTEVRLRPPTIGEWRKIREGYLAADNGLADLRAQWEQNPDSDEDEPNAGAYVWGDSNPYGSAFALLISELSASVIDADRLPVWATDPRLFLALHEHWRTIPVERINEPAEVEFDPVAAGIKPLPAAVQTFLNNKAD